MCLGGGSQPVAEEVYVPPELEKYEYEVADIQIGDSAETTKKKKNTKKNTTNTRSNNDLII